MQSILKNDDSVMVFNPKLAQLLGINESIILHQIHYWLEKSKNIIEEKPWVYNTYEKWQKQMPFLSESTVRKTIKKLEGKGIVISSNFNKCKIDKTKWYTIDYEILQKIYDKLENSQSTDESVLGEETAGVNEINNKSCDMNNEKGEVNAEKMYENDNSSVLNEQSSCSEITEEVAKVTEAIPEITPDITTEVNEEDNRLREGSGDVVFENLKDKQRFSNFEKLETFGDKEGLKNKQMHSSSKDVKVLKKDKLLTSDLRTVIDFHSENLSLPSAYELERIKYLYDEFKDSELIIFAIKQSIQSNARNLRYVEKVLYNWKDKGIRTLEEAEKLILDYKKYKGDEENGRFKGNSWENRYNNSKTSSKDQGKWTGYKPPEPRRTEWTGDEEELI